ncbi:MAG: hypothetical protein K2W82_09145 [Candidatus Obscuribacterales bacterium]|nr:hypothetical protein [Candidatus Obscuribacterales bacterium]
MVNLNFRQLKNVNGIICPLLVLLLSLPASALDAVVNNDSDAAKINSQTTAVLKKELELERLNAEFRMETSLVSPWRQRRMFLYSQANSWLTQVSLIQQMRVRYQLAREKRPPGSGNVQFDTEEELPDNERIVQVDNDDDGDFDEEIIIDDIGVSGRGPVGSQRTVVRQQRGKERGKLATANILQMVGQGVGASGALFEVGLNFNNYLRLRKKLLTPAFYRGRAQKIHAEIDELLAAREQACGSAQLSSPERRLIEVEGKMLKDLRDLSLIEYSEYHAAAKRFWTLQNTAYMVDVTKNMLGLTGSIINLTGNHLRRPRMQGGGGVFSILSGVVVLLTPVVGRVSGNVSGLAARRLVSRELTTVRVKDLDTFVADKQKLTSALNKSSDSADSLRAGISDRLAVYEQVEGLLRSNIKYSESQAKKAHATLVENVVFAGAVAPPRIANGVMQILGGWRYYTNPPLANKMYAAGATAYSAGTAFNILETMRVQASFERNYHKQRKTHSTSKDQFKNRLKRLDEMQAGLH